MVKTGTGTLFEFVHRLREHTDLFGKGDDFALVVFRLIAEGVLQRGPARFREVVLFELSTLTSLQNFLERILETFNKGHLIVRELCTSFFECALEIERLLFHS